MEEPVQLDLTSERTAEDQLITLPQKDYSLPAAVLAGEAYRLETMREEQRGRIAFSLIILLLLAVLATVAMGLLISTRFTVEDSTNAMQAVGTTVLTPIVGLIGAVIGFYFGGTRAGTQTLPPQPREGGRR